MVMKMMPAQFCYFCINAELPSLCLVFSGICAQWSCSLLHSLTNYSHAVICTQTELHLVQSPIHGQSIGTTAWNPIPRKEKDVVGATPKFTLFWKDLPCTLRKLMLAALLRLPQTFVTQCGSLCIFWYGKDTASSLQGLPITVPAVVHGACLLLWY